MANTLTNLTDSIVANAAFEAFTATMTPLNVFSRNFSAEAAQRGDKIKVLSTPAQDAAVDFNPATGYASEQNANTAMVEIAIDKHKKVDWSLTDKELSTMPQLDLEIFGRQKGFQLAKAVIQDIWGSVTLANYGAAAFTGAASTFDADDVVDIAKICDDSDWPEAMRSLVLSNAYHAALRKDNALQDASALGSDEVIRTGRVPSIDSFGAVYRSNLIPANGQNLVGFAAYPDALAVAMRYLAPQEGNTYFQAAALTDPASGLTIGVRDFYDNVLGKRTKVLECVYGYLKINGNSIKRLVSA